VSRLGPSLEGNNKRRNLLCGDTSDLATVTTSVLSLVASYVRLGTTNIPHPEPACNPGGIGGRNDTHVLVDSDVSDFFRMAPTRPCPFACGGDELEQCSHRPRCRVRVDDSSTICLVRRVVLQETLISRLRRMTASGRAEHVHQHLVNPIGIDGAGGACRVDMARPWRL